MLFKERISGIIEVFLRTFTLMAAAGGGSSPDASCSTQRLQIQISSGQPRSPAPLRSVDARWSQRGGSGGKTAGGTKTASVGATESGHVVPPLVLLRRQNSPPPPPLLPRLL